MCLRLRVLGFAELIPPLNDVLSASPLLPESFHRLCVSDVILWPRHYLFVSLLHICVSYLPFISHIVLLTTHDKLFALRRNSLIYLSNQPNKLNGA